MIGASAVYNVEVCFNGLDVTHSGVPFVYTTSPTLTAMTPSMGGVAGGTVVTVTGVGFTASALLFSSPPFQLWCVFGFHATATQLSLASVSNDNRLTCLTPPAPLFAPTLANVSVTFNQVDLSTSSPLLFTYYIQVALHQSVSDLYALYGWGCTDSQWVRLHRLLHSVLPHRRPVGVSAHVHQSQPPDLRLSSCPLR